MFSRVRNYVAPRKTSSPAEWGWLEFASQAAIFMGPVGAMLLGSGSRWGFVVGLATQPFWFIPPSVIANGASSLPVSSTPQAGQWGSTGTSDGPAIVGRDPALPKAPSGASISARHLFRKSWWVAALGQTLPSDGRTADDRCAGSERKSVSKVTRVRSTPQADLTAVVRWRPGSTLSGP